MDIDQFHQLLNALGDTSKEVAHSLAKKRITGKRDSGDSCPIAKYLKYEAANKSGIYLGITASSSIIIAHDYASRSSVSISTPTVIGNFITDFDSQLYPYLETI